MLGLFEQSELESQYACEQSEHVILRSPFTRTYNRIKSLFQEPIIPKKFLAKLAPKNTQHFHKIPQSRNQLQRTHTHIDPISNHSIPHFKLHFYCSFVLVKTKVKTCFTSQLNFHLSFQLVFEHLEDQA